MANFCMYCGKALTEGEVCSCPQAQEKAKQITQPETTTPPTAASAERTIPVNPQPAPVIPPQAVEMIHGFFAGLKELLIAPAKGARTIVEHGNFIISLILMGAQAFLAGIITLIYVGFHLEMDLGDCFKYLVLSIFISLLLTGITFGCSILASICMKGMNEPKKLLNALSLRCIAILPFTILSVPLSFLLPSFTLGLVFVCEIIGLFYEYFGFRAAFGLDESKTAYISILVAIVYIIAFAIIFRLIASDLMQTLIYGMFRSSLY